jgi:hypothetical protein
MLRLVLLYAIHALDRFPRVQDFVSSFRLGTWAKASAGKRLGTAGAKIGTAHRTWAFSEAAVWFLSAHPAAQPYLARWEKKHDKGTALTVLAQTLARAVSHLLQRQVAFERETGFQRSGRGADTPGASLAPHGTHLHEAPDTAVSTASLHAKAPLGHEPLRPALLMGPPLSLLFHTVLVANSLRGLPLPRAWLALDNVYTLSPIFA